MRPTAARSKRSSEDHLKSFPILSPSTTPSVYHHQQQQQQILFAPVSNSMVTLQPCGTALRPSCIYPNIQSPVVSSSSAHLHIQGKNNQWHVKTKSHGQQCYQQQQQLPYNTKPMVLFDQSPVNIATIPPSTASFIVSSSTFHAGPLHNKPYSNNSGMTHVLPQPFNFKSPDVQTLCLIQDRQNVQPQQHHQPLQSSYYNISTTNTCSLQTVNANSSFPRASFNYTTLPSFSSNQFPLIVPSSPFFSNSPVGLILAPSRGEKSSSPADSTSFKQTDKMPNVHDFQVTPVSHSENGWPPQIEFSKNEERSAASNNKNFEPTECALQKSQSVIAKTDEEHYSDESSNSFDFTIEAEKMVSALCNTTSSNDLGKEESKPNSKTDTVTFNRASDNKSNWFADFCLEYENSTSIGVQTDNPCVDRSQYPELIRKTAYWGCTQAENILDSVDSQIDSKRKWLTCLSAATKTAITKSSTCIPVFAGDQVFANDLINALLRISNGWLSLDNYLNKQHFPNLLDRLDPELIVHFQTWEESTCELLKQIVQTFQKFGGNKEVTDHKRNVTSSFPGDVSLYTTYDLFAPLSHLSSQGSTIGTSLSTEKARSVTSLVTSSLHNFNHQQEQRIHAKESKLRSKWTITDNLSVINSTKSVPNVSMCQADGLNYKFRTKESSKKSDLAQKSLNAEFCQLRDKVMESTADTAKAPINYSGYTRNCLSFTCPLPNRSDSSYLASNPVISTYGAQLYVGKSDQLELPAVPRNKITLLSQIEPRIFDKESEEMAANLSAWFASMRNAQPSARTLTSEESEMNENAAQRLLVQEAPKYSMSVAKQPYTDTNRQFQALQNLPNIQSTPWAAGSFFGSRVYVHQTPEEYDSSEDVRVYMKPGSYNVPKKRHQRRLNRRSTSRSVHANGRHNVCSNNGKNVSIPASSTPLSNVNGPVLSANVRNSTLIKTSFPPISQLPAPLFNLENSPRILKRTESLSQNAHQDVTWKAACASAEILLEALNVKNCSSTLKSVERNYSEKENKDEENMKLLTITSQRSDARSMKNNDVDRGFFCEASENDLTSTCRLSLNTSVASQLREDENALDVKTNVRTDSWLIRTLNNASVAGKQRRRQDDVGQQSLESSNNLDIVKSNQRALSPAAKISATIVDSEYPAIFSHERVSDSFAKRNDETRESESHVAKATYSETVRKSMKMNNSHLEKKESLKSGATNSSTNVMAISSHKHQRKDPEQSYQLLHKSRKSIDKKTAKNSDSNEFQLEGQWCAKVDVKSNEAASKSPSSTKTSHDKKKDLEPLEDKCTSKSSESGWSVWCSSKKKQNLSPLAFDKLEMIHRTIWQMDEGNILKYLFSCDKMEDYCKVVKRPMFFEIVEYKLKNQIYHKVEHAVKDFRRIINNARLYYQHDEEQTRKIETLAKKLEDLLEEHFSNLDFDSIIGSPREDSSQVRFKTSGQKSIAGRCDGVKKNVASPIITETSSLY
ncbi:hypothetical protein PUN28_004963 [Cardiocondyla obscurior]|uniref:Bromo domain-containing protein n=1 Tax=Cardiocondyla obscurior TaxID=286306 RepID=A0AAW2GFX4_9HYME